MSYMFCQFCGARNKANNKFCENCGQGLAETSGPQPQPQPAYVQQGGYQPYQPSQSQQGRSISGSYDAVPGQVYPYHPKKPKGVPNWVKVLIVLFFFGLPVLFVIIFFSVFWVI
ncbi:MAG: zinc ribbon domain-containing protein [Candidatus Heimdallarchaeota archaeon]|nr:zinc ribbon domain-containing protein [Candidatus Heimdallarchaeota archaeon]